MRLKTHAHDIQILHTQRKMMITPSVPGPCTPQAGVRKLHQMDLAAVLKTVEYTGKAQIRPRITLKTKHLLVKDGRPIKIGDQQTDMHQAHDQSFHI